jgi:hypothetical protein
MKMVELGGFTFLRAAFSKQIVGTQDAVKIDAVKAKTEVNYYLQFSILCATRFLACTHQSG